MGLYGASGTGAHARYVVFHHFCHVAGFCNFGNPVLPTLRGASEDVVTMYAY